MRQLFSVLLGVLLVLSAQVGRATAFVPTTTPRAPLPAVPRSSTTAEVRLGIAISPKKPATLTPSATSANKRSKKTENAIPFIIEEIPQNANDNLYQEICRMCIAAFFNDGAPGRKTPLYKEVQLIYLRNLQQADLKRRRKLYPSTNMMFVARRVVPATLAATRRTPLILDLNKNVYNLSAETEYGSVQGDYCRGEILGFVEVTLRPFGLGDQASAMDEESRQKLLQGGLFANRDRPILTNLCVQYEARKSGVGGRLLEQCERQVQSRWNKPEIVLEVEDDNDNALAFYTKRGYKLCFEDPTSRRYDTNGLLLRQLRCRRKILRKNLSSFMSGIDSLPESGVGPTFVSLAWQRIKESVNM